MSIELDDADRKILRDCPIDIYTAGAPASRLATDTARRLTRVKRLWAAGYVRGEVSQDGKSLRVLIRDAGRIAIGRPPIETPAAEVSDAPALDGHRLTKDEVATLLDTMEWSRLAQDFAEKGFALQPIRAPKRTPHGRLNLRLTWTRRDGILVETIRLNALV